MNLVFDFAIYIQVIDRFGKIKPGTRFHCLPSVRVFQFLFSHQFDRMPLNKYYLSEIYLCRVMNLCEFILCIMAEEHCLLPMPLREIPI